MLMNTARGYLPRTPQPVRANRFCGMKMADAVALAGHEVHVCRYREAHTLLRWLGGDLGGLRVLDVAGGGGGRGGGGGPGGGGPRGGALPRRGPTKKGVPRPPPPPRVLGGPAPAAASPEG